MKRRFENWIQDNMMILPIYIMLFLIIVGGIMLSFIQYHYTSGRVCLKDTTIVTYEYRYGMSMRGKIENSFGYVCTRICLKDTIKEK